MALPTSGPISISQIKAELGSGSNSLRALSAAAGKSTPDAMSEFYGYSNLTYTYYGNYHYNDPCIGSANYYTGSDGNWYEGDGVNFTEVTDSFVTVYSYYDYWDYQYYYDLYRLNYGGTLSYWGTVTSYCSPY